MDAPPNNASTVWWTSGLLDRIVSFLPPTDVACGIRLANRAAAALFRGPEHTIVRLSQPCPSDAFKRRWGAPGAVRSLSLARRRLLLCHTAASGVIANLEVAFSAAGCVPDGQVMEAAAGAGQLKSCKWLRERGCPWGDALAAAARAGHSDTCGWLLDSGCRWSPDAVYAAAGGGHLGLMEWLRQRRPAQEADFEPEWSGVFVAAAEGFDLASLQTLHLRWFEPSTPDSGSSQQQPQQWLEHRIKGPAVAAAACSPTPDWRAKLEWLEEELGCPRTADAAARAATLPDGLDRLRWLRGRGYPLRFEAVATRVLDGSTRPAVVGPVRADLLDFLVSEDADAVGHLKPALQVAAFCGYLDRLRAWHAAGHLSGGGGGSPWLAGPLLYPAVAEAAARGGRLPVLVWLVEELGFRWGEAALSRTLFYYAARNGDAEMVAWLAGRGGCEVLVEYVVRGGCEAALEWSLACDRGSLAPESASQAEIWELYGTGIANGDVATLRWLTRRLSPHHRHQQQQQQPSAYHPQGVIPDLPPPHRQQHHHHHRHPQGHGQQHQFMHRPQVVTLALQRGWPLPALLWLAEEAGAPLDWREVARCALLHARAVAASSSRRWPSGQRWAGMLEQAKSWRAATGGALAGAEDLAAALAVGRVIGGGGGGGGQPPPSAAAAPPPGGRGRGRAAPPGPRAWPAVSERGTAPEGCGLRGLLLRGLPGLALGGLLRRAHGGPVGVEAGAGGGGGGGYGGGCSCYCPCVRSGGAVDSV